LRFAENGNFLFAINLSETDIADMSVKLPFAGVEAYDLLTHKTKSVAFEKTTDGIAAKLHLAPGESVLLIKQGATFRQYAAQQQLLDSTIQATRGEIYDASGITLASTSVVWTIWADPSYSTALFTSQTVEETGEAVKTVDETTLADVSRQLTLRLLSAKNSGIIQT
ncbi:stage V sporulation protein D, spoVD, FtsI/pbp, partial [human gut metagenome]